MGGCRFVRCGMGGELWTGLGDAEWDVRRRGWEEGGKVRAAAVVVVVVVDRSTSFVLPSSTHHVVARSVSSPLDQSETNPPPSNSQLVRLPPRTPLPRPSKELTSSVDVDGNLLGTGKISKAAIIGLAGGVWAHSEGYEVREGFLFGGLGRGGLGVEGRV